MAPLAVIALLVALLVGAAIYFRSESAKDARGREALLTVNAGFQKQAVELQEKLSAAQQNLETLRQEHAAQTARYEADLARAQQELTRQRANDGLHVPSPDPAAARARLDGLLSGEAPPGWPFGSAAGSVPVAGGAASAAPAASGSGPLPGPKPGA